MRWWHSVNLIDPNFLIRILLKPILVPLKLPIKILKLSKSRLVRWRSLTFQWDLALTIVQSNWVNDCMDGGFSLPLHPLFILICNEFYLTPKLINPNVWRKALYLLNICLREGIVPSSKLFRCFLSYITYLNTMFLSTSLLGFLYVFLSIGIPIVDESLDSFSFGPSMLISIQY